MQSARAMVHATGAGRALGLLATLVLVFASDVGHGQRTRLEDLAGTYTLAAGEEGVDAAIEDVVGRMGGLVRSFARGRIRREVRAEEVVRVAVLGDGRVAVGFDEWETPPLVPDERAVRAPGPDGDDTAITASFDGERLVIEQRTDRGVRESWLSIAPDGEHLFLQVRISSPRLPAAIRYSLTYRRTE